MNVKNISEQITLKVISENEPSERLKKLISKGLLEEAEEFAKKFNLPTESIYEAKAKLILTEIGNIESVSSKK